MQDAVIVEISLFCVFSLNPDWARPMISTERVEPAPPQA
jgi:hypothetical protein